MDVNESKVLLSYLKTTYYESKNWHVLIPKIYVKSLIKIIEANISESSEKDSEASSDTNEVSKEPQWYKLRFLHVTGLYSKVFVKIEEDAIDIDEAIVIQPSGYNEYSYLDPENACNRVAMGKARRLIDNSKVSEPKTEMAVTARRNNGEVVFINIFNVCKNKYCLMYLEGKQYRLYSKLLTREELPAALFNKDGLRVDDLVVIFNDQEIYQIGYPGEDDMFRFGCSVDKYIYEQLFKK